MSRGYHLYAAPLQCGRVSISLTIGKWLSCISRYDVEITILRGAAAVIHDAVTGNKSLPKDFDFHRKQLSLSIIFRREIKNIILEIKYTDSSGRKRRNYKNDDRK